MLSVNDDIGKALTADEERALLDACGKSRSRSLLPFVTMPDRGPARATTLFAHCSGRTSTSQTAVSSSARTKPLQDPAARSPLNPRAVTMLSFWATSFPDRKPEHYVFPSEKVGLDGEEGYLKGVVTPYETNPEKPMGSWKTAWNYARKVAGLILAGNPENAEDVPPARVSLS